MADYSRQNQQWLQVLLRHPLLCAGLGCIIVLLIVFLYRFFFFTLVLAFTAGGGSCGYLFFNPDSLLPNILVFHTRKKKDDEDEDELTLMKKKCPVCGDDTCTRHRPELNIVALKPWTNLKIPQKVDSALHQFLDLVLKEFVYTWYSDLSRDEAFVDELRASMRFIVAVLTRRMKKVDIPTMVTEKVLRVFLRHLHHCLRAKKVVSNIKNFEQTALDLYGKHLHIALRNRKAELDYLRAMTEKLFPYILPVNSLKCRSLCVLVREIFSAGILLPAMDVIADPDIVNKLVLLFLDDSPPPENPDPPSPLVTILADFSQHSFKNNSCLHLELSDILKDPKALYPFMQFMKTEASVSVLQFYLSVEEFNTKLLQPEMSQKQLNELHQELLNLYRMYCDPAAPDHIQFDEDIVSQIKEICDGPPEDVVKLQRTTALFRAYEHTYQLLQTTFLPLFHQSDDYYSMLCGERLPSVLQRSQSWASKKPGDSMSLSRLGNRIKSVFRGQTVEGKAEDVEYSSDLAVAELRDPLDDGFLDGPDPFANGPKHDLSTWRVSIPAIASRPDQDNPKKMNNVLVIEIRRVDRVKDHELSHWRVDRSYAEFYILEQKLLEFHGENIEEKLPPKKTFGTKSMDFLESKKESFEKYLQSLLTKPFLRGSELLHRFLSSKEGFSTSFLSDLNFGKFVKSNAMKLVREKGQHIDPFLQSFLVSTEAAKPKPSKADSDSDTVSISSEKMANPLYDNNAGVTIDNLVITEASVAPTDAVNGPFDTLIYVAKHVFASPDWVHDLLFLVRMLVKPSLEGYLDWYLNYKVGIVTQEHRIEMIIHLLRDVLFFDNDPPRTDDDKRKRREEALSGLKDFIPKAFISAIGREKHQQGTEMFFNFFQQPRLNKQFTYTLLDMLLGELFPELLEYDPDFDIWDQLR